MTSPGILSFSRHILFRRVRQNSAHRLLPIILVTALHETEDRVKGIEAGCDDFISKPVDKMELLARVRSLLKVKAYNDLMHNYRKELELAVAERTAELAELNADLENKISERTANLNQSLIVQNELNYRLIKTTDDLENEKNKLRKRNELMEKDLDMAKIIQKCFIPSKSPLPCISFTYKPMEKVGGDFFDFIQFTNSNWIGIFISDVSGHGVSAAFITAMIKRSILQISPDISNPSDFLKILNDIQNDQTAGYYITSFYGIYKPDTREFINSNAGHNPPYIINDDTIEYLSIQSTAIPLAILNNNELSNMKKGYIDEMIVLEEGSKLILYTDGLTEAAEINYLNAERDKDFESEKLSGSFRRHSMKPAELFLKEVYKDLVEFRGCDDFEDDICIICLDVAKNCQ
jgi:serine phosphatase RsbU (regulator of sigma subunit)